ncbi:fungal-specific transcription factor domain-containing protein [Aspergillus crustosus]
MNKSFDGCWTCRLRRKKCDEQRPRCAACAALSLTCQYSQEKPDWMDGGVQQKEMTEHIKREVKAGAHRRRWERVAHAAEDPASESSRQPQSVTELSTVTPSLHTRDPAGELVEALGPRLAFGAVLRHLASSPRDLSTNRMQIPSAEQAAFSFSSTLLVFDDIISSTVLRETPRLHQYYQALLDGPDSPINPEDVVGCQGWVLLAISQISCLDARKQECKRTGNLDKLELVRRALPIKAWLEDHLTQMQMHPGSAAQQTHSPLAIFIEESRSSHLIPVITRIWTHAALLYHFLVVSGWQPASEDVSYHVNQVLDLMSNHVKPRALLRTMVWPFAIASILAQASIEHQFLALVQNLQLIGLFGTIRNALEVMEMVWRGRVPLTLRITTSLRSSISLGSWYYWFEKN